MADLDASPATHRWLWWLTEVAAAIAAGVVAYFPLHHTDAGLALAITAAATVGYVGLTNEMAYLSRRQVRALERQVQQQERALIDARTQASAELRAAQEAAVTAERTVQESVRARYDAFAPKVAIKVGKYARCVLEEAATGDEVDIRSSHYLERDDAHNYTITVELDVQIINYGPAPALVKSHSTDLGAIWYSFEIAPDSWLLPPPSSESDIMQPGEWVQLQILTDVFLDNAALLIGASPDFGAKCSFQIGDLLNQVIDTHTLVFRFSAIIMDGSRIRLPGRIVPVQAENGGVASVVREYRDL